MSFIGKKLVNLLIEAIETPDKTKFKGNFHLSVVSYPNIISLTVGDGIG